MSSNRLIYDDCASDNQNNANKGQLSWIVDDNRFQNSTNKAKHPGNYPNFQL